MFTIITFFIPQLYLIDSKAKLESSFLNLSFSLPQYFKSLETLQNDMIYSIRGTT